MPPRFSIVYPTRHRPEFVREALRSLEQQRFSGFEVIVSDNFVDPAMSCERICADSGLAELKYIRPPKPVGMVENWNHALQAATGDYVMCLTDKMFVLPGALEHAESAIEAAGRPDIISWTSDAYNPRSPDDYLGSGTYVGIGLRRGSHRYASFSPSAELDRRGRAEVARAEQSPADYARGKIVFGAYGRGLIERIISRSGRLFHEINPDYTSLVLGLSEAREAIELPVSCVVSINTAISNGFLSDTDDAAALAFLKSLGGGSDDILSTLFVPGLYASLHNWVAHDYVSLRAALALDFEFDPTTWLAYCSEDIHRPGRRWSSPAAEDQQEQILASYLASLAPAVRTAVERRVAVRASRAAPAPIAIRAKQSLRAALGRVKRRLLPSHSSAALVFEAPSIQVALERVSPR